MDKLTRIAVVEDNAAQRMILTRLLENEYTVNSFESGEAFLGSTDRFDAILLDIEMPGLNGYDTCSSFRKQASGSETPVIFVSAHDTVPERVAAYEAGGDDFLTKPIAAHELRHKLHGIIEQRQRVRELAAQSSDAQRVAFSAMTSMGDLGVVIEFLQKSALASTNAAIAARLIVAMKAWGLRGAVQVRGRHDQTDLGTDGPITTMQSSVLETLRNIGRIFEMGSRAVINFQNVSLLVENLPIQDPEKVGRLRDHLAVLAESADMRLHGLAAMNERDLQRVGIEGALAELKETLLRLSERTRNIRHKSQSNLIESLEHLARMLGTVGLTEIQAGYVDDLIKETQDETRNYFDEAAHSEEEFADVLNRLERLAVADYRL